MDFYGVSMGYQFIEHKACAACAVNLKLSGVLLNQFLTVKTLGVL
jgi:hypothetical protein